MENTPRRPGLSLIEVVVSTVILGVVSIAYATTSRGQFAQRDAYEDLAVAMEMCSRQIDYLRALDVRRAKDGTAFGVPFTSAFTGAATCPDENNMPYPAGTDLEYGVGPTEKSVIPGGTQMSLDFLSSTGTYTQAPGSLTKDGNAIILADQYTVGPQISSRPRELWMPPLFAFDARNYSCVVRASRVRAGAGAQGVRPVNPFQALIHFQISIFKGQAGTSGVGAVRRPVLVMNYLREADLP